MTAKRTASKRGSGSAAKRLYDEVTAEFELSEHELVLLRQACRIVDALEDLQKTIDGEGVLEQASFEDRRPHPALVEARQQSLVLGRLLKQLGLPMGVEGDAAKPKQRNRRTQFNMRALPGLA